MVEPLANKLSRRERQIVDILFSQGQASAQQVQQAMEDAPSYSTVRALLARLVEKNAVGRKQDGAKYLYFVLSDKTEASEGALERVVKTFFEGSAAKAVNALLGSANKSLTDSEIADIESLIKKAKQRDQ
ncbi:MAG: BlaI/MecI/CopY family transcriptional regulator [Cellvibrionaceae bacterium]